MNDKKSFTQQEFLDYISGKLPPERMAEVDAYLKENPLEKLALEASMEYAKEKPLEPVLESLGKKIDGKVAEHDEAKNTIPEKGKIVPLKKWLAIAASFLVLISVSFFIWKNSGANSEKIFAQYFDLYPDVVTEVKRGDENAETELVEAMDFYEKKEFEKAIRIFSKYSDEVQVQLYIAISELGKGNADSCLNILNKIEKESGSKKISDGIIWYKALAYLKKGDTEKAKNVLMEISGSEHYKKTDAMLILKKL